MADRIGHPSAVATAVGQVLVTALTIRCIAGIEGQGRNLIAQESLAQNTSRSHTAIQATGKHFDTAISAVSVGVRV